LQSKKLNAKIYANNTYNRTKQSKGADYPQRMGEFGFAPDSKKAIKNKKYRR
jgi:hypothetical protein